MSCLASASIWTGPKTHDASIGSELFALESILGKKLTLQLSLQHALASDASHTLST